MRYRAHARVVLAAAIAIAALVLVPTGAVGSPGFYLGPIFGISTGPDDELLVANAGRGIVDGVTGVVLAPASEFSESGLSDVEAIPGRLWQATGGGPGVKDQQFLYHVDEDRERDTSRRSVGIRAEVQPAQPGARLEPVRRRGPRWRRSARCGRRRQHTAEGGQARERQARSGASGDEEVSSANAERLLGESTFRRTMEAQPVATSVAIGPDGAYYVGDCRVPGSRR